jgi:hypothetical protein
LEEALAREYITHEADNEANIHAIIELEPEIPAAIPGTINIPEPIVPPSPRLTRSKRPIVFLYFFSFTPYFCILPINFTVTIVNVIIIIERETDI